MARIRKFCAQRNIKRPYTRVSRYRAKNYTRGNPHVPTQQWIMGNKNGTYPVNMVLVVDTSTNIRTNAIESARQACNRILERQIGKGMYKLEIKVYPHHIIRENPLASGAGADRMSTGMKKSFGKTVGRAAIVRKNQEVLRVGIPEGKEADAKQALRLAKNKFPVGCSIRVL